MTTLTITKKPWLLDFLILAAIWGVSFLFLRIATVEIGPLPTAALRVAVASVFLIPLLIWRGDWPALRDNWKPIFLVGITNSAIPFVCFSFAVLSITTGLSAILNATTPLFGALVAWLWLRDKPTPSRLLGLTIGFIGVALLAWGKASFKPNASGIAPAWAVLACLVATLCYGISGSLTKRYLAGLPALATATGSLVSATLCLALPALWLAPQHLPSTHAMLAILGSGVLCTGVAYVLFFRLIEKAGPARALAVTFLVPVFAVLFGVAFLHEEVTLWMLACAGVIVLGTALSTGLINLNPALNFVLKLKPSAKGS